MTFNDFPCVMRITRIYLYFFSVLARPHVIIGVLGVALDTFLVQTRIFLTFKFSRLSFLLQEEKLDIICRSICQDST